MKTFRNAGTFRASTTQLLPVARLGEPFGVLDGQAMQARGPSGGSKSPAQGRAVAGVTGAIFFGQPNSAYAEFGWLPQGVPSLSDMDLFL